MRLILATWVAILIAAHLRLGYDRPRVRPALGRAAVRARAMAGAGAAHARSAAREVGPWLRRTAARPMTVVVAWGLVVGLLWSVTFWRLIRFGDAVTVLGINDHPKHLASAHEFSLIPFRLNIPEFLYHLVTKGSDVLLGQRIGDVAALVLFTALAYVALVLLLREAPRTRGEALGPRASMVAAGLYFVMETPVLALLVVGAIPADTPFSTLHWWGNPTYVAAVPFTFFALPLLNRTIETSEADDGAWHRCAARWQLTIVLVLGTLAKPTFTLMLIPALPLYLLVVRRASWRTIVRLGTWAIGPTAAVVLWQTWFLGTGQSDDFQSTWKFAPIVQPIYGWAKAGPSYLFPILIVALALWASRGAFVRERSVQIVAMTLVFAVPLMLTIRETGNKAGEGNMAVPAQACIGAMMVLALRTVAWEVLAAWKQRRATGEPLPAWVWVGIPAVIALTIGGVLSLLDGSGLVHVPANWELQYQGT